MMDKNTNVDKEDERFEIEQSDGDPGLLIFFLINF